MLQTRLLVSWTDLIAGGANVVQQQDAARINAAKDVIVEARDYSVFRRVAAGCDSVQTSTESRLHKFLFRHAVESGTGHCDGS